MANNTMADTVMADDDFTKYAYLNSPLVQAFGDIPASISRIMCNIACRLNLNCTPAELRDPTLTRCGDDAIDWIGFSALAMTTLILGMKLFNFKPPDRNCLYYFGKISQCSSLR